MLVNTARALKYLKSYGQGQSELFTELEKYHNLPTSLEDFKSQCSLLKEETSRNIENLLQAIQVQQSYSTTLCGHVSVILTRILNLENQVQKLTTKSKMEQDKVQLNAQDFNPDIDGPEIQKKNLNATVVSNKTCLHHLNQM